MNISPKRIAIPSLLAMLLLGIFPLVPTAQADETQPQTGELTVPWDEFKHLLNLEKDQVVLSIATFHKLLAQSTQTAVPPYATQNGNVVLSRTAFDQLVNRMKPPVGTGGEPPFEYLMTKAVYSGTMQRQNTSMTATFQVHVLSGDSYLKVPVLPGTIALENVTVNGQAALIVSENGHHSVVLSRPGEHVIEATYSVKSSLDQGPQKIDLMIQQTPITLLRLEIPLEGIEVEIPQAQQLRTTSGTENTIVSAAITPGRSISVRWRDEPEVVEKVPPKLYAEIHNLVSIEDDVFKINSNVRFNILHSEVDRVRFAIPEGVNVLSVTGEGVGEWQEVTEDDDRVAIVPFTYGRKGAVTVHVVAEKPFSDEEGFTGFSGVRALDCVRETGFLGIEVRTSAEVTITESSGLEPIGVPKLPPPLHARAVKPLMHGFKYLKHPYDLSLAVRKHDKIAVPVAAITSANVVTLFTEDGKVVHRLVYQVTNSAKQFLEIRVPDGADIWTVFVDNQPVESAINREGTLLVPLIRSRSEGSRLSSFPVEVVYCLVGDRFSVMGDPEATLPSVDLLISQLMWSVYLPNDYRYIRFSSTLEKERIIRGLNLFAGAPRKYDENAMAEAYRKRQDADQPALGDELGRAYKGKEFRSEFRNQALGEEQMASQVIAELEFGRRMESLDALTPRSSGIGGGSGVLPIEIQVPTGGQVYRFARTIIRPDDPLSMSVTYSAGWVTGSLEWIGLLMIGLWLYLKRWMLARAFGWVASSLRRAVVFATSHWDTLKTASRSVMTPIILLGLLLPAAFISGRLTAFLIFLLWLSVMYQIVLRLQQRAQMKAADQG